MTHEQILLTLCRRCRDAFATACAALEELERKSADADQPSLFDSILKAEPAKQPEPESVKVQKPADEPREIRHRTPSDYRGRNAREGYISTTKISEQLTGKPHGANKEVIRICKEVGITLHKRSVNPDSCSHLYVNKAFIPTIVHQYHANHA